MCLAPLGPSYACHGPLRARVPEKKQLDRTSQGSLDHVFRQSRLRAENENSIGQPHDLPCCLGPSRGSTCRPLTSLQSQSSAALRGPNGVSRSHMVPWSWLFVVPIINQLTGWFSWNSRLGLYVRACVEESHSSTSSNQARPPPSRVSRQKDLVCMTPYSPASTSTMPPAIDLGTPPSVYTCGDLQEVQRCKSEVTPWRRGRSKVVSTRGGVILES